MNVKLFAQQLSSPIFIGENPKIFFQVGRGNCVKGEATHKTLKDVMRGSPVIAMNAIASADRALKSPTH